MLLETPRVSVVNPCYNLGAYLPEAVQSVLSQTFHEFEIIVVNDGSDDPATRIAINEVRCLPVRIIEIPNQGVAAARNAGIQQAKGEYVCCLDADDSYHPDFLEKTVSALDSGSPDVAFVTSWAHIFGEENYIWETSDFDPVLLGMANCVHVASVFRKKCWQETGGYSTSLSGYQDWNFWLSIVSRGYRWTVIKEPLFNYRVRPASMVEESDRNRSALFSQIVEANASFYSAIAPALIARFDEEARRAQREVIARDAEVARATKCILERDAIIHRKNEEVKTHAKRVAERSDIIRDREQDIERLCRRLQQRDDLLREKDRELGARLSLISAKDEALANRDGRIRELEAIIHSITRSKRWRTASFVGEACNKILPKGSLRRWLITSPIKLFKATFQILRVQKERRALRKVERNNKVRRQNPVFSVIVPIYDREEELRQAIESILSQTFQNFELLLICDGSPQTTLDVVAAYESHPQVRVYKYAGTSGNACKGRNKGIDMARGSIICFLDSDDIAEPDRLQNTLYHFYLSKADVLYGSVRFLVDGSRTITGIVDGLVGYSNDFDFELLKRSNTLFTCTVAVKKKCLKKWGGFRREMTYCEDYELWLRLAHRGCRFVNVPNVLSSYRVHAQNAELKYAERAAWWRDKALDMYQKPYGRC